MQSATKKLPFLLRQYAIHIFTDGELTSLLTRDAETATDELVAEIKNEYVRQFNTEFKVSAHSMAVEIWGHVYADEFAKWIKTISDIGLIDKGADMVIFHAAVIDIGEHGHDSNRFFLG